MFTAIYFGTDLVKSIVDTILSAALMTRKQQVKAIATTVLLYYLPNDAV